MNIHLQSYKKQLEYAHTLLKSEDILSFVLKRLPRTTWQSKILNFRPLHNPEENLLASLLMKIKNSHPDILKLETKQIINMLVHQEEKNIKENKQRVALEIAYKRKLHGARGHSGMRTPVPSRVLCLECRSVNSHASGCSRDDKNEKFLPIAARVPKRTASTSRWKQFAKAMSIYVLGLPSK